MKQNGFAHIFLILFLLAGIAVAVYLVQFTQVFKPQAAGTTDKITNENFEPILNPFGDAWAWKKSQNTNLPVSVGGAALKQYVSKNQSGAYIYQDPDGTIKEALAQYYAKTNAGYVYLDSYEPQDEGTDPRSIAVMTRAKQINPNIKFLGYYVQWEAPPGWGEIITKANAGEQYFENFLVHREGYPATKENRITARPDKPEWGPVPLLDITNPNVRSFVVPKLVAAIQAAKMDGVMNDGLFFTAVNAFNSNSNFPNNNMPADKKTAWAGAMAQFVQEIKSGMQGTNLEIFGNVDDDHPEFAKNDLLRAGRLDGAIFEDPFNGRDPATGRGDPTAITKVASLMDYVDSVGKKAIFITTGAANGTTLAGSSGNPSQEILAHRYFLAAYMMVMRNGNNMFEYHYPTSIFYQFNSQAFFREWNLNLGAATSGVESVGSGVVVRRFEKGYVYWNPTNSNYTIQGGRDLYHIDNGQNIDGQVVPALSGAFFVTSSVLQEYNTPPVTSPPPPPPPPPVPGTFTLNSPVTFCAGTNSHVRLSWTASPNGPQPGTNSGYFIYIDGVYKYNALHALNLDDPEPKTPGQTYKYKIESVVIPDGRTFSNEQTVTAATCSLSAPNFTDKTLAYCNGNTSRIHLEWNSVSGATVYKIFRSTTAPNSGVKLGETTGVGYNDETVTPGVTYQYSIEAGNANTSTAGQGINIVAVSCTPSPSPSPSRVPSPSISPSPSVSPSPSAGIRGDADRDGDVDIFDFNLVLTYYGRTDVTDENVRKANLKIDGKIDIFDISEVLSVLVTRNRR